jgi:hypothetical protein
MRTHLIARVVPQLAFLPLLVGCASTTSYVRSDDTTLGRVVLYRNGVAYFERTAEVKDDTLKLAVPADKVDDFLKSLTVVDAATGKPAPIAYPTDVPRDGTGLIDMKIRLPEAGPHKLRLSYVTEAPAWKPSYRLVVNDGGKVDIQGWAIVDNTSGEDWNQVRLGVGSSSALSFRFDLRSIRSVHRETLQADGLFAFAPPTGASTYGGSKEGKGRAIADFSDDALAALDTPAPPAPVSTASAAPEPMHDTSRGGNSRSSDPRPTAKRPSGGAMGAPSIATPPQTAPKQEQQRREAQKVAQLASALRTNQNQITIEGFAAQGDADKKSASLDRANKLRDQLVRQGIDPSRVVAVGRADVNAPKGGVRIVEEPPDQKRVDKDGDGIPDAADATGTSAVAALPLQTDPIGTSHFESTVTMSVPKASSAMVSILDTKTDGGVVYLYDPESTRGNANFAFKSVRLVNPTDSVLESGPVTVFGQGRFIGEGLSEPIPARSAAFVPFALDRQIVVERKDAERDEIAKILTVQRGVFSTEVKHFRRAQFVVNNRLGERAVVYVRQTLAQGYAIEKGPEQRERMGAAHLFRVELEPHSSKEVVIESATPVLKSLDLRTPTSFETVRVYLSSSATGTLKERVAELTKFQTEIGNLDQRIQTTREQMSEYRARLDELHAQLVTLKLVKSAGPLMQSLEKKMQETSDRVSKATIELVSLQEKLMVARVRFQDGVAELSLEDKKADDKKSEEKKAEPKKS